MVLKDRRQDFRFHPPNITAEAPRLRMTLLDLGRSGMSVESHGPAPIACGDEFPFRLDDGTDSVEILGQVRWAEHSAPDQRDVDRSPRRKAGIAFIRILTAAPPGIWKKLIPWDDTDPQEHLDPGSEQESPRGIEDLPAGGQLIEMVAPADGAKVASPVIEIVGRVDAALAVVSVSVNGVAATLEGNRFLSTVHLKRGDNKISATIHKSTGGYKTCLLGTLKLDPRWNASRHRYPE